MNFDLARIVKQFMITMESGGPDGPYSVQLCKYSIICEPQCYLGSSLHSLESAIAKALLDAGEDLLEYIK